MGRLLGLELNNFKSYRGTISIGFGDSNFTSIIGPNGSGKSNLMDAISFVLGVKSVHLRSHLLADLIYRGSLSHEEDSATGAEVQGSSKDPVSAYVKAFYTPTNQAEDCVELCRTISKEHDSTYQIDGKIVNYKKYSDFLESQNILIKARNFLVFQGDVEQVASQKPQELTTLFEHVSGSIQYKQEYDQLREDLERARSATSDAIQSRKRAHAGLKSFKEGANRDEEYRKYMEERTVAQQRYIVWQLYHLKVQKDAMTEDLEKSTAELRDFEARLATEEDLLKKKQSSFAKAQAIVAKQKTKLVGRINTRDSLSSSLLPLMSSKSGVEKQMVAAKAKIDILQKDVERQRTLLEQYTHQLNVVRRAKDSFTSEIQDIARTRGNYTLSCDDLQKYEELREEFLSSGGSKIEDQLLLEKNDKKELLRDIELYNQKLEESIVKVNEDLGVQQENLEAEVTVLSKELNEKNAEVSKLVKKLRECQSRAESNSNREYEMNYRLKETLSKLDDMDATQRETAKERKLRENVATLRRLFPGVKGLVHDLCRPKKEKYATAVSTVLGYNFDSVIVDNLSVARQCISFLKKQRSGIISFIPLDTISVSKVSIASVQAQGCSLAIDAIEYDPELERAFQYVCSDAMICDSLSIAKEMKWKRAIRSKLVSLDGSIVHKAGLMTGGTSIISGNRWDKEEYQSLISLKDTLLDEIAELSRSARLDLETIRNFENDLSVLSAETTELKTQAAHAQRMLKEKKVEIDYQRKLAEQEFKPKIEELQKRLSEHVESITKLEKEKLSLQNTIYSDFAEKVGFTASEYEAHSGEVLRKQSEDLRKLQLQMASSEKKVEFEAERLRVTQERQQKSHVEIEKAKIKMESLLGDCNSISEEITAEEALIVEDEGKLEKTKVEANKLSLGLNALEETIQELTDSLNVCKSKQAAVSEDIEKLSLEKINILKNCKMLNINLPEGSSPLDIISLDKVDVNAVDTANSFDVEFGSLSRKLRQNGDEEIGAEFKRSIEELNELLTVLQPNSKAAGRYEDAKVKYDQIYEETEKCKRAEKQINEQFVKVRNNRREDFHRAFDHVSGVIEEIYRELTRDPHSTAALAGGTASLTLEDEDEPYMAGIRYHATPPTQRFKDMEYLSGGEKTIAALALLFAINSYQPSPFFILDEVDAALDISNVERIATYIRKQAQTDLQFIVISLINTMFEKSQALVGVFRQQSQNTSRALTLNLENFAD
ncbi:LADA_0A06634g1_1 [Lachancea dasiensis]|uniref:Structural maintenance of chromosomes protein n=1 Tax=Lachancea dasiensis TaxID=1072105 RepID=A0A1G4IPJ4_9SACH|nr:LADA_0A06634g1_1 [Lachancea dasiensis]